jgi:hypothetical protein
MTGWILFFLLLGLVVGLIVGVRLESSIRDEEIAELKKKYEKHIDVKR